MNDFDRVEFKKHLKKIVGYLDEIIKHYKIKVKVKKKKGTRS